MAGCYTLFLQGLRNKALNSTLTEKNEGNVMVIDHIGIVVKSIEAGIKHWKDVFGYQKMTNIVTNSKHKVKVVFLCKENSMIIKLVEPTDESSPIYKFSMRGGGLHHLCFKCKDMHLELQRLDDLGLRILTEPEPSEAFDGESIAFLFAKQGLYIELIETDKKANVIKDIEADKGSPERGKF